MLQASLLQRGEDRGDSYRAKEMNLKGFVGAGVPQAARAMHWRREAGAKELVDV